MTTVGLIRHGLTKWNELGRAQGISDIPLNRNGKQQALALAKRLSYGSEWDFIVSSDLLRAKKTAEIIATELKLKINIFDERIRETNCGKIEGTTEKERLNKWGGNWKAKQLGMEKFEDVSKRGMEFLKELVNTYKGKRILLFSHGALIGLTLQRLFPIIFPETYIDHTSITILRKNEDKWDCELYNCTKHLDQKIV